MYTSHKKQDYERSIYTGANEKNDAPDNKKIQELRA